jgi:hypothetical protein
MPAMATGGGGGVKDKEEYISSSEVIPRREIGKKTKSNRVRKNTEVCDSPLSSSSFSSSIF